MKTKPRHPLFMRVAGEMTRRGLIQADARVLVAVSGGPDSVCLLAVLDEVRKSGRVPGLHLHIAHVNYGLRGEESDGDEAFVREVGAGLGIPVSCKQAKLQGSDGSLQSKARAIRYEIFERLCKVHDLRTIATGHTADDQAETILLWLLRGTGTTGLAGIPLVRDGTIIRPLLHCRRSEILDYLDARGLRYRIDSSNATSVYRRNVIRQDLLPLLHSFNPRIIETLARTADIVGDDMMLLQELEQECWTSVLLASSSDSVVLDGKALQEYAPGLQRRMFRRAWTALHGDTAGLTFRHVASMLDRIFGSGSVHLPGGIHVRRDGDRIIMDRAPVDLTKPSWTAEVALRIPGAVDVGGGRRVTADVLTGTAAASLGAGRDSSRFFLDVERAGEPLRVRCWRAGDWFCPLGMGGRRKKLQDFFMDRKLPRELRYQVPLVVAPAGIVWVAGQRGDERVAARQGTSRVVVLSLEEGT